MDSSTAISVIVGFITDDMPQMLIILSVLTGVNLVVMWVMHVLHTTTGVIKSWG